MSITRDRMPRITKDPEVRRNELMDVAEQLFAEKGYDHTSPSDIIRKSGVAQGTFYYYFKSRDDLIRAIIARYLERYEQYVSDVAADPQLGAPEKMRRISDELWDLSARKARLKEHVCEEPDISGHEGYRAHVRDHILPLVQQVIRQGIDEASFKVEFTEETAGHIIAISKHLHDELKQETDPGARTRKIEATRATMEKLLGARKGTFRSRS
jgi:AcrR family transcriptional regulator